MPEKLYRFEINDKIFENGSNSIYEALDPSLGRSVRLYKWSPPTGSISDSLSKLDECIGRLGGLDAEVFSDSLSFYLAAGDDAVGREALALLLERELFTGNWPGPVAVDSVADDSGSGAQEVKQQTKKVDNRFRVIAAMVLMFGLVVYFTQCRTSGPQAANAVGPVKITFFRVSPATSGDQVLLSWDVTGAKRVTISPRLPEPMPAPDDMGNWTSPGIAAPAHGVYVLKAVDSDGHCLFTTLRVAETTVAPPALVCDSQ